MNETDHVALVDTDRNELRGRIAAVAGEFERVARAADPDARAPRMEWTVREVVAHVLTIAHRYREVMQGRMFRAANSPREVDVINREELDAAMASRPAVGSMLDQIRSLAVDIESFFDTVAEDAVFPFHCNIEISAIAAQTNWLGELLLHGEDIAKAADLPCRLRERDMLLVSRGLMEMAGAWVRDDIAPDVDVCVAFVVKEARPYVMHIHDGTAETRARRSGDRPDAVLRAPASVLTAMLYQRIGPMTAARKGLFIVGGRRPWTALKLQSYFESA